MINHQKRVATAVARAVLAGANIIGTVGGAAISGVIGHEISQ